MIREILISIIPQLLKQMECPPFASSIGIEIK